MKPDRENMIVDLHYWSESYKNNTFSPQDIYNPIVEKIYQNIPKNQGCHAVEIGCFPGGFLYHLGKLGYTCNGCDIVDGVETEMQQWLITEGIKVAEIKRQGYVDFIKNKTYDLVASFGFIEHFEDYKGVFRLHHEALRTGGYLVISWPNFSGRVQLALRKFLDKDNLENHVLQSMDFKHYEEFLRDYEIVYIGPVGKFEFWVDDFNQRNGRIRKFMIKVVSNLTPALRLFGVNDWLSPYKLIIAKKTK